MQAGKDLTRSNAIETVLVPVDRALALVHPHAVAAAHDGIRRRWCEQQQPDEADNPGLLLAACPVSTHSGVFIRITACSPPPGTIATTAGAFVDAVPADDSRWLCRGVLIK
jgi:hypothetical protein